LHTLFHDAHAVDNWPQQIAAAFQRYRLPDGPAAVRWRELVRYVKKEVSLEVMSHMCKVSPCMNYGECVQDINTLLGFSCTCVKQFVGVVCDIGLYWL